MIYGVGVDTASVERLAKSIQRVSFLHRVFGPKECALFEQRGTRAAETAAAHFAAKEAFGKALGVGILTAFALTDVQVLRGERGAPWLCLSGKALALAEEKGLRAHLSLTHEGGFATAFVVLEQAEKEVER